MIVAMSILLLWQGFGVLLVARERRGKEGVVWTAFIGALNLAFGMIGLFL